MGKQSTVRTIGGTGGAGVSILNRVIRVGHIEDITFEQRFGGDESEYRVKEQTKQSTYLYETF